MFWGQSEFEKQQTDRPEFGMAKDSKGNPLVEIIHSPIHGDKETYFPPETASFRKSVSNVIINAWIMLVFVCSCAYFLAKVIAAGMPPLYIPVILPKSGDGFALWGAIADVFNVLQVSLLCIGSLLSAESWGCQVIIFGFLYKTFTAEKLNRYENHRTDTEFEDALISKVFIFNFINTFMAVFAVAFIKQVR